MDNTYKDLLKIEKRDRIIKELKNNEKLTFEELIKKCNFSRPTLSDHIKQLELEEIIAFSSDEKDRRKKYYYLTDKGLNLDSVKLDFFFTFVFSDISKDFSPKIEEADKNFLDSITEKLSSKDEFISANLEAKQILSDLKNKCNTKEDYLNLALKDDKLNAIFNKTKESVDNFLINDENSFAGTAIPLPDELLDDLAKRIGMLTLYISAKELDDKPVPDMWKELSRNLMFLLQTYGIGSKQVLTKYEQFEKLYTKTMNFTYNKADYIGDMRTVAKASLKEFFKLRFLAKNPVSEFEFKRFIYEEQLFWNSKPHARKIAHELIRNEKEIEKIEKEALEELLSENKLTRDELEPNCT